MEKKEPFRDIPPGGPRPASAAAMVLLLAACALLPSCGLFRIGTRLSERYAPSSQETSVSQYGVTWTFSEAETVGRFANGDFWVLAPVDIVAIEPAPLVSGGRVMNGSMLNPAMGRNQGYDSMMYGTDHPAGYLPELNAALPGGSPVSASNPLRIAGPSSLISGISVGELGSGIANQVRTMAVLTVLDALPPAGAFRPPYLGADKEIRHTTAMLDWSLLPSLPRPSSAPDIAAVAARFERPWVEHMLGWIKECFLPRDNMPNYGREIASVVSDAALCLVLDYSREEKEDLAVRLVQLGIDYYAITRDPAGLINWEADGGHMSGRPFPILFAGLLLGDEGMRGALAKSGRYAYQDGYHEGNLPPDYLHFGELDQTFFVTQRDVDRTNETDVGLYGEWDPDPRADSLDPYQASDIGLAEWGVEHAWRPNGDNRCWELPYRNVAGMSWSGYALASRILDIADWWNHPAFFAYVDRYMEIMEGRDERTHDQFQEDMWEAYRAGY